MRILVHPWEIMEILSGDGDPSACLDNSLPNEFHPSVSLREMSMGGTLMMIQSFHRKAYVVQEVHEYTQ